MGGEEWRVTLDARDHDDAARLREAHGLSGDGSRVIGYASDRQSAESLARKLIASAPLEPTAEVDIAWWEDNGATWRGADEPAEVSNHEPSVDTVDVPEKKPTLGAIIDGLVGGPIP